MGTGNGVPMAPEESRRAIHDMLYARDCDAFARADWDAVREDFHAEAFVAYRGGASGSHPWTLRYPDLESYRDDWLAQARELRTEPADRLARQLRQVSRIEEISLDGPVGLVRKEFDGVIDTAGGPVEVRWRTYYFVRYLEGRWKVTGFVGYLPPTG